MHMCIRTNKYFKKFHFIFLVCTHYSNHILLSCKADSSAAKDLGCYGVCYLDLIPISTQESEKMSQVTLMEEYRSNIHAYIVHFYYIHNVQLHYNH